MSDDNYVTPVKHTGLSAFGTTAGGAAGGAIKGGLGAAALWIGAFALAGLALGLVIASGGLAGLLGTATIGAAHAGTGLIGFLTNPAVLWGGGLAAVGGAIGIGTSWLPGGLGAIFGGIGGGAKASHRVSEERAAAMQMEAQVAAMQAQLPQYDIAPQQTNVGLPAQGSRFNEAASNIDASSIASDGRMSGMQLQRA